MPLTTGDIVALIAPVEGGILVAAGAVLRGLWRLNRNNARRDAVVHVRLEQLEVSDREFRTGLLDIGNRLAESHEGLTQVVSDHTVVLARLDERLTFLTGRAVARRRGDYNTR